MASGRRGIAVAVDGQARIVLQDQRRSSRPRDLRRLRSRPDPRRCGASDRRRGRACQAHAAAVRCMLADDDERALPVTRSDRGRLVGRQNDHNENPPVRRRVLVATDRRSGIHVTGLPFFVNSEILASVTEFAGSWSGNRIEQPEVKPARGGVGRRTYSPRYRRVDAERAARGRTACSPTTRPPGSIPPSASARPPPSARRPCSAWSPSSVLRATAPSRPPSAANSPPAARRR